MSESTYSDVSKNNDYYDNKYDSCDDSYDSCDDSYDEDENIYREPYNFSDYVDLISVSEYVDNPDFDKITNIILALSKTNNILNCKETSFTYDFSIGEYNKWKETAKLFNENIEFSNDYRILIDEEAIVCKLIKDDENNYKIDENNE